MNLKTLILAAGKGTRMKSDLPKVLHKVNGIPMIKKIIEVLNNLNSQENILILGHEKEMILDSLGDVEYVVQEKQLGTGHAIMMSEEKLKDYDGDIMVVCGDTPLLTSETLEKMHKKHRESGAVTTILTSIVEDPYGYGRIVKENGLVSAIVEEKEATENEKKIKEINAGVYCFDSKKLFKALSKIEKHVEKNEYYLTDVIAINVNDGEKVETYILENNEEVLGVNSKVQLAEAEAVLRNRKNLDLMNNGVILIDPKNTYIEDSVEIGADTVIYPGALLQGETTIGKNCEIIGNTRILDSKIGNNVNIQSSVIKESILEQGVTIGPFAHIRPKSHLKEKVHIGNFVEVKKSVLETGVKAGHLTYLGDAEIGSDTNIGAGTITCNYDGKNKHKTKIGKDVFIGSDSMLVAPLEIGDNALTGAGSVITKDIPSNALGVARSKQTIKKEWNKK
ncbi:bifunctional UDP-N-acetylglucosamine diphosphorylase/glucosamine-1-phosphate N-acetyltransferase GlmU [uncultured Ilyobacter sp.]|uniref:bifunctional UDP-N-acetylglucosamine diphosphorylase/glucosamine-1-phosphate N-acetyltransferase GlmU n=1 Tax=uncultured Ilyobacter sp. TaxID=544433 RepID=UPI0029BFB3C0|nr:bifunctional UDP-N-acetylglucosamine diphosphorylase/glucosamine-1-phosphate N-acetyltransferase GlmU [uncultured Ilyobacter sp.]